MKQINANNLSTLPLGRQGENLARQIVFDLQEWQALYGSGTVELLHQRSGDYLPRLIAIQQSGPDKAVWTVTAADTAMPGAGRAELRYYSGDTRVKSVIWPTSVEKALETPQGEPAEPMTSWLDQLAQLGAGAAEAVKAAEAAADRAETAAVRQPVVQDGTWWTWDAGAGEYADTGVSASGSGGGTGNVSSRDIQDIQVLDRTDYDALEVKDPNTLYLIRG